MKPRTNALRGLCGHKSPLKQGGVDLTKKTGLGPRTDEAMELQFPQGGDKFREEQEDRKKHPLGMEDSEYVENIYKTTEMPRQ